MRRNPVSHALPLAKMASRSVETCSAAGSLGRTDHRRWNGLHCRGLPKAHPRGRSNNDRPQRCLSLLGVDRNRLRGGVPPPAAFHHALGGLFVDVGHGGVFCTRPVRHQSQWSVQEGRVSSSESDYFPSLQTRRSQTAKPNTEPSPPAANQASGNPLRTTPCGEPTAPSDQAPPADAPASARGCARQVGPVVPACWRFQLGSVR